MKLVKHKKLLAIRKKRNKKRADIRLQTSHGKLVINGTTQLGFVL